MADEIKVYVANGQDQINEMRNISLNQHLYIGGWMLIDELYRKTAKNVALAYDDKNPVGIILVTQYEHVMVFVKEEYRRKGIATKLIRAITLPKNPIWGKGMEGSAEFFRKEMPSGVRLM